MIQQELPEGYKEIKKIDLQGNIKLAVIVQILALLVMVLMIGLALIFVKFPSSNEKTFYLKMIIALVGSFILMFLHELTHGAMYELFSGKRSSYGISFLYFYSKSTIYFDKRSYRVSVLASPIIWTIALVFLQVIIPLSWFWAVYPILVFNVGSSVSDVYLFFSTRKIDKNALIFDEGYKTTIYEPVTQQQ